MFLFAVLFSIGVALLRGGRPDRLASFPFKHVWLVFAAFGVQLVMHLPVFTRLAFVREAAPYLYPSAYYLLLLCFALNWRAPGVPWLAAGSLGNMVVILANGGKMPVDGQALIALGCQHYVDVFASGQSLTNTIIGPSTKLPWLADVIIGSPPFSTPTLFSVGDVLLAVGVFLLVQRTMVPKSRPAGRKAGATAGPEAAADATVAASGEQREQ